MAEAGWRGLWRFSLRLYARPGVEAACLRLQDRWGADVNLLLLCCWLEGRGRRADGRLLRRAARAVAAWRAEVTLPLRRARRRLRLGLPDLPAAWSDPVRHALQAVELRAEQVEQRLLARAAARAPARGTAGPDSLERYRRLLGAPPGGAAAAALQVLREAAGPGPRATGAAAR